MNATPRALETSSERGGSATPSRSGSGWLLFASLAFAGCSDNPRADSAQPPDTSRGFVGASPASLSTYEQELAARDEAAKKRVAERSVAVSEVPVEFAGTRTTLRAADLHPAEGRAKNKGAGGGGRQGKRRAEGRHQGTDGESGRAAEVERRIMEHALPSVEEVPANAAFLRHRMSVLELSERVGAAAATAVVFEDARGVRVRVARDAWSDDLPTIEIDGRGDFRVLIHPRESSSSRRSSRLESLRAIQFVTKQG